MYYKRLQYKTQLKLNVYEMQPLFWRPAKTTETIVIEKQGLSSLWSNYPRCPLFPVCLHYSSSLVVKGLTRPLAHPRPGLKHPPGNYAVFLGHVKPCSAIRYSGRQMGLSAIRKYNKPPSEPAHCLLYEGLESIRLKQNCNKRNGAIKAKVIRLTWKSVERNCLMSKYELFSHTHTFNTCWFV